MIYMKPIDDFNMMDKVSWHGETVTYLHFYCLEGTCIELV